MTDRDHKPLTTLYKGAAHYEEAKRLVNTTFVKGFVQQSLQQQTTVPSTVSEWIQALTA